MQIETGIERVVSLLLKGEDYDTLCPDNEDVWYDISEVEENGRLKELLSEETIELMQQGEIDYIVCRGNF